MSDLSRIQARAMLRQVKAAVNSDKPMTNLSIVLGMDPEIYPTAQDWQDALAVRIADLRAKAER